MNDEKKTFLATLIAGAVLRAIVVFLPFMLLMQIALPDDAYYYFDIARNIADGHGITYDRLGPTNGFHPLWLAILVPVFWIFPKFAAIRVAVGICAAIDVLNIFLVQRATKKITGSEKAANIAAFVYAINVPVILVVINAMESAVSIAFFLLLFLSWLSWRGEWSRKRIIVLGLIGGALVLSRTDCAIFLALILLGIVIVENGARRFTVPLAAGAIAAVIAGPFLLWNAAAFGSPMQISGKAIPLAVHRENAVRAREIGEKARSPIGEGVREARDAFFSKMFNCTGLRRGGIWLTGLFIIIFLAIYISQRRRGWGPLRPSPEVTPYFGEIAALGIPLLFMLILAVVHGGVRWFVMTWYFVPAGAIWAVFLGISIYRLLHVKGQPPGWAGLVASNGIVVIMLLAFATEPPKLGTDNPSFVFRGFTKNIVDRTLAGHGVPPDARIGAFNSGIVAFYSEHPCANLDGVVSYGAYKAIENKTLDKYIRENNIRYIVDRNIDFERYAIAAGLDMKRLQIVWETLVAKKRDHWTREEIKLSLVLYKVLP